MLMLNNLNYFSVKIISIISDKLNVYSINT